MSKGIATLALGVCVLALSACATTAPVAPSAAAAAAAPAPALTPAQIASQAGEAATPDSPPAGHQWLFGSAEGSIALRQTWDTIASHAEAAARSRPTFSVVLEPGATATDPRRIPCGNKPLAAVFDADETLLWNLGAMRQFALRNQSFDPALWMAWERSGAGFAVATPGSIEALARMRAAGVTVIVNTNRTAGNAEGTVATLRAAGLGDFVHGQSLYLMGDAPDGSGKDGRRAMISANYCVVALVGDQLGDIADLFNERGLSVAARRQRAESRAFTSLWNHGWFVLANPVYGPSIRGSFDDIFPADSRWEPPVTQP